MDSQAMAFVISVTLMKGCYRHIKIAATAALDQLSSVILDAFYFVDDHAHAFFMDNKAWSDADCYYMDLEDLDGMADDEGLRHTSDFTLSEAGLKQDMQFVYIFDFGDDWRFQCRVLKVLDELVEVPEVIRSVGTPPPQQP